MEGGREIRNGEPLRRYGIAVVAVVIASAVRLALTPWLDGRAHYLMFTAAVAVAAIFGGSAPAILAACLAAGFVLAVHGAADPASLFELLS